MVYGGRPRPTHGRWSSRITSWHIRNSQFFGEYNRQKHLTVEIIQIIIVLRLNREQGEAQLAQALRHP
ncbi:hypothetical protein TNCV_4736411 [Trichonephila clavipes]|nr:hypothetical protein TNCV_4736411 [Trichonephila clavipes]